MTFLIIICVLSVIVLASTAILAYRGYSVQTSEKYLNKGIPVTFWDLYNITYRDMRSVVIDKWHTILPHIHEATTYTLTKFIAYRDRVVAKLFGYHAVPQGGVVSFFLKRIVAHKEEFKQKMADKNAQIHPAAPKPKRDYFNELKGEFKKFEEDKDA